MIVPDLLHELEIGVWKSLFIHLLRLLNSKPNSHPLNELDSRYRQIPTFGRDTIRRFRNNVSEMKQLAARDFEDLLQCAIPVFEGLFDPEHERGVLSLLYIVAHWHGLAKLRLHTDQTLEIMDDLTTQMGDAFRKFQAKTCSAIETKELPREYNARIRREAKAAAAASLPSSKKSQKKVAIPRGAAKRQKVDHDTTQNEGAGRDPASSGKREKTFSLRTFKFHALGHYVSSIRRFGTTENYSTQGPENYHRFVKARYRRTSKKRVTLSLSRIEMRQARIRSLRKQLLHGKDEGTPNPDKKAAYFIGKSQNAPVDLTKHLRVNLGDPVAKGFLSKLKAHLLPRIRRALLEEARHDPENYGYALPTLETLVNQAGDTSYDEADSDRIYFDKDRLYEHKIFNINYTAYNTRREQDILNPSTGRRDFMCLNEEDPANAAPGRHRFCYGRVLGVYHTNVVFKGRGWLDMKPRRFDVLLVRWYAEMDDLQAPWSSLRLDRLEFPPLTEKDSINFLDPALVLRACHIVPRFVAGRPDKNPLSAIAKDEDDWKEYYVNRFVDRDMIMRYHWGLGVGHKYSHKDAPTKPPGEESEAGSPEIAPVEEGSDVEDALMIQADAALDPGGLGAKDGDCDSDYESDDSAYGLHERFKEDIDYVSDLENPSDEEGDLPEPEPDGGGP
ncbi:hypothetical protein D9611_007063 [Ephemerocybe angulata]|uniref:Uncharacterized protein n=1 Tax=Ephemerocybe angulata TaxID=980116 RepID=A0A8H5B1E3_9AGAR|nr:hypothetical protein D9611_007063 [Tulosesus angulatus]